MGIPNWPEGAVCSCSGGTRRPLANLLGLGKLFARLKLQTDMVASNYNTLRLMNPSIILRSA
jgi:hypothetical protein